MKNDDLKTESNNANVLLGEVYAVMGMDGYCSVVVKVFSSLEKALAYINENKNETLDWKKLEVE